MLQLFQDKQLFTYVILFLYFSNCLYQFFWMKDFIWGGYWLSAACITIFAMLMSGR